MGILYDDGYLLDLQEAKNQEVDNAEFLKKRRKLFENFKGEAFKQAIKFGATIRKER